MPLRGPLATHKLAHAITAVAIVVSPLIPTAGAESEAALKAEFLLKFARFTDWPSSALSRGTPLAICVAGDPEVAEALGVLGGEKIVAGRPLAVRVVLSGASMPRCHILYVAAHGHIEDGARRVVIAQPAVLSISDEKYFTRTGGIVELTLDNERMHFAVNVDAARRAGLQISSRLLNLATIVRDTRW